MKVAVTTQQAQMKNLNVDELEDLQDDMQDMMADQDEIQEVLSKDYTVDAYDEAELEQELEELDTDIVNEKLEGNVGVPSYLPQKEPAVIKKDAEALNQIMNK